MRRRHAGEQVEPYRRRQHAPEGDRIRGLVALWACSQPAEITDWPDMPDGIEDRDADVWEPLLAVADAVGGDWPRRARSAAVALVAASKEVEPSLGIRLLADIRQVFDADTIPTKVFLQKLHAIDEAPWHDLKGKPLDERGLAHRLRQFGVKSKNIRVSETVVKGYEKADFEDVWLRYLPPPAKSATAATTLQNGVRSGVALVADFPEGGRRPCAQCGGNDGKQIQFDKVWLHKECKPFWLGER
jgi:hypothetical protein